MDVPYGKCFNCGGRYCSNDCNLIDDFDEEEDYFSALMMDFDRENGVQ